jgi:hypothetical protein
LVFPTIPIRNKPLGAEAIASGLAEGLVFATIPRLRSAGAHSVKFARIGSINLR